jgi:hypothetical protein
MVNGLGQAGVIPVVPPAELERQLQQKAAVSAAAFQQLPPEQTTQLVGFIRTQFEMFRNHRNTQAGWSNRLLAALRTFNGQYEPGKLQEIQKFGGSQVYARLIAQKCRAASSLLRDVYLGTGPAVGAAPAGGPGHPARDRGSHRAAPADSSSSSSLPPGSHPTRATWPSASAR